MIKKNDTSKIQQSVQVLSLDGQKQESIDLPNVFSTPFRPEVIQRVYNNLNSHVFQKQGRYPAAGQMVSAESRNTGLGISRIARARGEGFPRSGQAAGVASVRHGRLAHPPLSWKNIYKKINKKEKLLAICSAIAATTNSNLIRERGHVISDAVDLPIVLSNDIENISKSKELKQVLIKIGLVDDLYRGEKHRNKAIKRHKSNRRSPLSAILIVSNDDKIGRLDNSIPGISVKKLKDLSVLDLAPGSKPVRLTIFSKQAIEDLKEFKSTQNIVMELLNNQ
ncbi:MAG: 50S ribosomal protein L4 [Nitrososphaeraceae archaeon]